MEGVLPGNSPIELRYLNPLMVFHYLFHWNDYDKWEPVDNGLGWGKMNGSIFSIELNINIIKSLSVNGQLVFTEYALPGEIKSSPVQPPDSFGYMAGINYSHSFNSWGSIYFLEFIYTDPYLYMLYTPFASFIHMDRSENMYNLIGYPRDTLAITIGTEFFNHNTITFSGSFSFVSRGEHNKNGLKWDWSQTKEAMNEKTPTGITENRYTLSLGTKWKLSPIFCINANIAGIVSQNNNHIAGSNKLGGEATFIFSFTY
jgi:hypothetical protein